MESSISPSIIQDYKNDPESVYHTWFLNNEERLKAFRTIRNGLKDVIAAIENKTFGNDFKGSPLEIVVTAISEQKQIFEGAAHAFFWKPKLRIPDIYENEGNQLAFGRFLKACLEATNEKQVIEEILKLDKRQIKGLGPAVANILYFLHPTLFPPFNTAIVNGFNALFDMKLKLGSWTAYLQMRQTILDVNERYRTLFSKDLGALSGLLFEVGAGRLVLAGNAEKVINIEEAKRVKLNSQRHTDVLNDIAEENEHSEIQYHLARLGKSLGYKVWIASNDHKREFNNIRLGEFSLSSLPLTNLPESVRDTVSLIDVLWLNNDNHMVGAFEVEKSTSIYSGILRLYDLSLSTDGAGVFYLVAPDKREKEIKAQLLRPAFQQDGSLKIFYILFSDLRCDCDAMCKFGTSIEVLNKISRSI